MLARHVQHGARLDGDDLRVGLIHDLTAGLQLRAGEHAELAKQLHGLVRRQAGHGGDHARQIRQAAARCLGDPIGAVAVAVEDDAAVLAQVLGDDAVGVRRKVRAALQLVSSLAEGLGDNGIEHSVRRGDAVG